MSDVPAAWRPITVKATDAVALTAAAGLAVTILTGVAGWEPAYENGAVHLAKETATALVLLMVAALLAGRVARTGALLDLLALAGVLVLAIKNLVFSFLTAALAGSADALTSGRTTGAGMIAAALLAVAALAPRKVVRDRRRAILITAVSSLAAFAVVSAVTGIFELPGALTDRPETSADLRLLGQHPGLVVADLAASVLFLIAGGVFAHRAQREADEFHLWLGIGATIAAIGYLNYALSPSPYTDLLHAGDLYRVAAVLALGIGTIREVSRYQAIYAPAAVFDKRQRVARDLHDGVAQELAFIDSRLHRLRKRDRDDETISEIAASVRRAMDASRRAMSTLSRPLEEPLNVALTNTAREAVGLADTRLELDLQTDLVVPAAWEPLLQDIVREAVVNAVQHGRARTVTVRLQESDRISLRIADDGDGFDPGRSGDRAGFGLISIRERSESLGGGFRLTSSPGRGTCLEVVLP